MNKRVSLGSKHIPRLLSGAVIILAALLAAWSAAVSKAAASPNIAQGWPERDGNDAGCLDCHYDMKLIGQFEDLSQIHLSVDLEAADQSIHTTAGLECTSCHETLAAGGHQQEALTAYPGCYSQENGRISSPCTSLLVELPYPNERAMTLDLTAVCSKCHQEEKTIAADNVHLRMLEQGNLFAPICVDCHGSHTVSPLGEQRGRIATICASCHQAVYSSYRSSVHGTALDTVSNPDVPTCIDCHGVHNIQGPRDITFRNESVYICEGCHANKELMEKYGISVEVFQTYLNDIHGSSRSFLNLKQDSSADRKVVCVDCHGIHNIRRTDDPLSTVSDANIQSTCMQCHEDEIDQFPGIWLSHFPPSIEKNPGWAVAFWIVRIIVPAGMGGYLLFIAWNEAVRWFARRRTKNEGHTSL